MGGNVTAINKKSGEKADAQKIPLKKIGLDKFRSDFTKLFEFLNKEFNKKFKEPLWKDFNLIKNGYMFNGSTSFIMNNEINPDDIIPHKPSAGDIDIMVPEQHGKKLWGILDSLEGKTILNVFTYLGCNRLNPNALGNQINSLFKYHINKDEYVNAQIDFELSEFDLSGKKPSEFAKFSHSSSFEDVKTKVNIKGKEISLKGFHHKLLLRALVGAMSVNPDIVIATGSSTPDKIRIKKSDEPARMMKFSVIRGLGQAYEPMLDKGKQVYYEGKPVFIEKKSENKEYITDIKTIFNTIFKKGNLKDFESFVGLVKLLKSTSKEVQNATMQRYFDVLFGMQAQVIEPTTPDADYEVKMSGFKYFLDYLNLKFPNLDNQVEKFYRIKWKAKNI